MAPLVSTYKRRTYCRFLFVITTAVWQWPRWTKRFSVQSMLLFCFVYRFTCIGTISTRIQSFSWLETGPGFVNAEQGNSVSCQGRTSARASREHWRIVSGLLVRHVQGFWSTGVPILSFSLTAQPVARMTVNWRVMCSIRIEGYVFLLVLCEINLELYSG